MSTEPPTDTAPSSSADAARPTAPERGRTAQGEPGTAHADRAAARADRGPAHDDRAAALPLDADIDVADTPRGLRPVRLRPRAVGLVALGGAAGTGVREALALTWPTAAGGIPVTIFAINIVGAFVLGVLLEFLGRRGSDEGRRRAARLLLGTGVLGGFTTYSTFMTDAANLAVTDHALGVALAYAAASLLVGVAASALGVALGSRIHETARRRATLEPARGETTRSTGATR